MTKRILALFAAAALLAAPSEARDRAVPRSNMTQSAQTRHPRPNGFVPQHIRHGIPYHHNRSFEIFFAFNYGNAAFDSYYYSGRMYPFGCGPFSRHSREQLMGMQHNPRDYRQDGRIGNLEARVENLEDRTDNLEYRTESLEQQYSNLRAWVASGAQSAPRVQPTHEPVQLIENIPEPPAREENNFIGYDGIVCPEQYSSEANGILNRVFDNYFEEHGVLYHAYQDIKNGIPYTKVRKGKEVVLVDDYSFFKGKKPTGSEFGNYIDGMLEKIGISDMEKYLGGPLGTINFTPTQCTLSY